MILHRFTYYDYDHSLNRSIKNFTPWHPSKEQLESIYEKYYPDIKVSFETVLLREQNYGDNEDSQKDFENTNTKSFEAALDAFNLDEFNLDAMFK